MEKIKNQIYLLLRKSEKFAKTDMVYLAKGSFWLTIGQGVSSLSSFLLAIAFANLLSKETYGNYKYILSIFGILSIFTLPGMGTAVVQSVARNYEGIVYLALKEKIKWGAIGGLLSLMLGIYYCFSNNFNLSISFTISSIFLPLMDTFSIYDAVLNGKKLFKKSTTYYIISQIFSTLLLVFSLFFVKNIYFILLIYFLSWTICRYIFYKVTINVIKLNNNIDLDTLSYGKQLSLMGVIGAIANYLDRLLLFHYLGAAEVAIYSIAIAPPEQIKSLLKNISVLALPKFSTKERDEVKKIKKIIYDKIIKVAVIIILITIIYLLLAPFFFGILFPKYHDSIQYSQLFSLSLISVALFIPLTMMQAQKMSKELYQFNLYTSSIQIILLIFLIPNFGLPGAIMARVISRFFNLTASIILMNKGLKS